MIALFPLLLGLARAECPADLELAITTLRHAPSKENYDCVVEDEAAAVALIDALQEPGEGDVHLSRALAVWRLGRMEEAITPAESRAYNAADRRLVRDGVMAFRGRQTPSPEHKAVFEQLGWYAPSLTYTDGRLTEQDHANIAMLDDPPAAEAEVEVEAPIDEPAAPPAATTSSCRCTSAAPTGGGLAMLLAGLALGAARRRR